MEKRRDWEQRIVDYSADLMDKHFPKGECKERGKALVFNAKLITYVMGELDKAREEGRKELLDSIIEGVTQLKDLVSMFNPMSPEIRAKQSGEIEAYNGLLEKLSKLTTK